VIFDSVQGMRQSTDKRGVVVVFLNKKERNMLRNTFWHSYYSITHKTKMNMSLCKVKLAILLWFCKCKVTNNDALTLED
jgi:hypothetical protein